MASGALVCTGDVTTAVDGAPICSSAWMLVQVPAPFDPASLDAVSVLQAFGAGFILVATVWGASRGIRAVLSLLK